MEQGPPDQPCAELELANCSKTCVQSQAGHVSRRWSYLVWEARVGFDLGPPVLRFVSMSIHMSFASTARNISRLYQQKPSSSDTRVLL